eukprot:GILK01008426.1.p1 GENE.GILK01008426.1~~GILK01008426.1.p1  ORF type:complete len:699 (-),score=132.73 GILK01008426.1:127-2223(-)
MEKAHKSVTDIKDTQKTGDNHETLAQLLSLSSCLRELVNNSLLSDVVFLVGENRTPIMAHKAILAIRCAFFRAMFGGDMREAYQREVYIPNIPPDAFLALLHHLYTGSFVLNPDIAMDVMAAANQYGLDEVKRACSEYIYSSVDASNACFFLHAAQMHEAEDLFQYCFKFIEEHTSEVFSNDTFLDLTPELLIVLLKSDHLNSTEMELFQAVIRWGAAKAQISNLCMSPAQTTVKPVTLPDLSMANEMTRPPTAGSNLGSSADTKPELTGFISPARSRSISEATVTTVSPVTPLTTISSSSSPDVSAETASETVISIEPTVSASPSNPTALQTHRPDANPTSVSVTDSQPSMSINQRRCSIANQMQQEQQQHSPGREETVETVASAVPVSLSSSSSSVSPSLLASLLKLRHAIESVIGYIRFPLMDPSDIFEVERAWGQVVPLSLVAEAYRYHAMRANAPKSIRTVRRLGRSAVAFLHWNPNDKHGAILLSNNNLTAKHSPHGAIYQAVRTNTGFQAGRHYFEVQIEGKGHGNFCVGVADTTFDVTKSCAPIQCHNWVYWADGKMYDITGNSRSSQNVNFASFTVGDTVGIFVDMDKGKVTFYKNGEKQGRLDVKREIQGHNISLYPTVNLYNREDQVTIVENPTVPRRYESAADTTTGNARTVSNMASILQVNPTTTDVLPVEFSSTWDTNMALRHN